MDARVRGLASALSVWNFEEEVLCFLLSQRLLAPLAVMVAGADSSRLSCERSQVTANRSMLFMLVIGRYIIRERRKGRAVLRYEADDGERDEEGSSETAFEGCGGSGAAAGYRERQLQLLFATVEVQMLLICHAERRRGVGRKQRIAKRARSCDERACHQVSTEVAAG